MVELKKPLSDENQSKRLSTECNYRKSTWSDPGAFPLFLGAAVIVQKLQNRIGKAACLFGVHNN